MFVRTAADDNHNVIPDDLTNYKVARAGSLVINKMKAWQGSMGIAPCDGIVSPAYFVYDFHVADRRFGSMLLRSRPCVAHFGQASDGVRVGQWDLSITGMREIPLALPSPDEQAAIVRFLDHANRRIERFIRVKRKLIALLNEQKQAIINHAVTRGFDASVPMKESGVPWLGEIPAHRIVRRAKYLFREIDERSVQGSEELLSVSHITGVTPRSEKNVTMFKARSYAGHKVCRPGDPVINTMWAWMAALGVSRHTGIVSPAYAVYRPRRSGVLTDTYVDMLLRTRPYVSNYVTRPQGFRRPDSGSTQTSSSASRSSCRPSPSSTQWLMPCRSKLAGSTPQLRKRIAKSPSSASTAPASSRMSSLGSSMCGRRRRGCLRRTSSRSTRARRSGTRMGTPRSWTARRRGRRERRVGAAGSI